MLKLREKISDFSWKRAIVFGLGLAVLIELVTVFLRFGLGLESHTDSSFIGHFTFGWRIHHGYPGVLLLLVSPLIKNLFWRNLFIIAGTGLLVSDIVHHFCVLWPVVGNPEFYLRYPEK